jgi:hypothetical protein
VFGIDRDLRIVANTNFRIRRRGTAVRIGERNLTFAALFQSRKMCGIFVTLLFERFDLFC